MSAQHDEQRRKGLFEHDDGEQPSLVPLSLVPFVPDVVLWGDALERAYHRSRMMALADPNSPYAIRQGALTCALPEHFEGRLDLRAAYVNACALVPYPSYDASFAWRAQLTVSRLIELTQDDRPCDTDCPQAHPADPAHLSPDSLHAVQRKAEALEAASLDLCVCAAAGVLYGVKVHMKTISTALERLMLVSDAPLARYPAMLLLYSSGVAAVLARKGAALRELIIAPVIFTKASEHSIHVIDLQAVFESFPAYGNAPANGVTLGNGVLGTDEAGTDESDGAQHRLHLETGIQAHSPEIKTEGCALLHAGVWRERLNDWVCPIISLLGGREAPDQAEVRRASLTFELIWLLVQSSLELLPDFERMKRFLDVHVSESEHLASLLEEFRSGKASWVLELFTSLAALERAAGEVLAVLKAREGAEASEQAQTGESSQPDDPDSSGSMNGDAA